LRAYQRKNIEDSVGFTVRQESAFYMDSERKQHELSNAQWLSKLVSLVDIREKSSYLNVSLQAGLRSRYGKESGVLGGVGFLKTQKVDFFHPTPEVQLNHSLHLTPNSES